MAMTLNRFQSIRLQLRSRTSQESTLVYNIIHHESLKCNRRPFFLDALTPILRAEDDYLPDGGFDTCKRAKTDCAE